MVAGPIHMAYILAALLFIAALAGLSKQETAKYGCLSGMFGMGIALLATFAQVETGLGFGLIVVAMIIGAAIGIYVAQRVAMTQMPEMIACLHSFVGLAAVLVGFNSYFELGAVASDAVSIPVGASQATIVAMMEAAEQAAAAAGHAAEMTSGELNTHLIEIFIGIFIGAVTFTGSIVAYGKLNGTFKLRVFKSAPLMLPGGHYLNLAGIIVSVLLCVWFMAADTPSIIPLVLMTLIAFAFGVHLVAAIGGADMPVVISMLNSYSGWAAAASGFMLSNDLLIVTGALVGSSGAILSYIMCKAMNRSFISVIAGGFGNEGAAADSDEEIGEYHELKAVEVADLLKNSSSVIIAPGYGMAVSQAQAAVASLTEKLQARGTTVRFAIHPVAGRLPGHMNVLLAEAKVPYDIVLEMDEINDDFEDTDTVLVIGANDTVNPAALENPNSPIAGMPVLEVWKARNVVIFKRSMNAGYAGVQNPLFFKDNSFMCFGDAKKTVEEIVSNI
ncbi:MAG: Re/Si-specific NAD(P)(+) transhydrogenase subunit beta [Anaerobiospirillum succiniciproducens]|uniref:Re/Si-specific NAD(P)(+) transhydrogenase subunit beta n=1 Tax=Anaerobiospirillum succiniciproducens TaxID=13335 RepID=UPI002352B71F|nr:Re/Si-specific NAD(P)(+) transhydrogenase subunit beta [Anaerobiospirillum succiniciproducens]MCI6863281.1 Re/Si-specific NAD(P)(+) transhydrogenase subunit beta [Anaerobiospirillum succiniciproducens]MDY2799356.1 Re/Si-specific NAD(P)(+) transhydrogenase subunit beta [Anaerobiospirillum succiniciproducens]